MIIRIASYYIVMAKNSVEAVTFAQAYKIAFFILLGAGFLFGLYSGFYRLISYVDKLPLIGPILIYKLLAMIFLAALAMIIFSSIITALNTLYFSKEVEFLFALPLSSQKVFTLKSLETSLYSVWMVMLIIAPFIAAFAKLKGFGLLFYAASFAGIIPYLFICSFTGILTAMVLFYLFPNSRLREIMFIAFAALGSAVYMLVRFIQPERLVNADMFEEVMAYIVYLKAPTAFYLPSWRLTELIRTFAVSEVSGYFFNLFALYLWCILLVAGVVWLAGRLYFQSFNNASNVSASNKNLFNKNKFFKGIFAKEIKQFFRSTEQWPQLFLLASLIAVYVFSVYKLPIDTIYIKMIISFLNIGFAGFVLSAIALRFVFPAVSLEGRPFWILKSAPVEIGGVMLTKWFFYAVPMVFVGALLAGLSSFLLEQSLFITLFSIASVTLMAVGLTGMGIGFGSIFPKFNVANIAKIESSAGGIFYMVCSLFYVGLVVSIQAVMAQVYFYGKLNYNYGYYSKILILSTAALLILHSAACLLPMIIGKKKLEKYEFENSF